MIGGWWRSLGILIESARIWQTYASCRMLFWVTWVLFWHLWRKKICDFVGTSKCARCIYYLWVFMEDSNMGRWATFVKLLKDCIFSLLLPAIFSVWLSASSLENVSSSFLFQYFVFICAVGCECLGTLFNQQCELRLIRKRLKQSEPIDL